MLIWTILFGSLVASAVTTTKPLSKSKQEIVPNAYILQLTSDLRNVNPDLSTQSFTVHEAFHQRAANIEYDVRREFRNPDLFLGLSIDLKENLTEIKAKEVLQSIPGVVSLYHGISKGIFFDRPISDVGNSTIPKVTGDIQVDSTHRMCEIDKLHALGIKGKGIKIGIVDTGVDYHHPSLGNGFGPGHKIAGGYAFVDDEFTGFIGVPIANPDPLVTCNGGGHGSHVSGIIGMEDPDGIGFGLIGVAPEASLYMYRVFSCYGVGTTDIIMAAMQRAADDEVDIINMSLSVGPDGDWPTELNDPLRQVTAGLTQKGIVVVAAQGNEGSLGVNTDSAPAIGVDVIAVGSIANTYFPVTYTGTDSKGQKFQYASVWPINRIEELDVVILTCEGTFGCTDEELNDTFSKVDANNTIILVSGPLANYAPWIDFNINYFGILNEVQNPDPWANEYNLCPLQSYATHLINIGGPSGRDSSKILDGYKQSGGYGKYKLKFGNCTGFSVKQTLTGGMMSNYSTFGPALDTWGMKPEISAPGGNILSTWPLGPLGGYSIVSGTSMASPFVAGCYALVKSQFPHLSVDAITVLLQSTSRPVPTVMDKALLSTTVQQGAGLVNPYRAITYQSFVYPGELNIGSEDNFLRLPKNITITNKSSRSKTYVLGHQGAGYVEAFPYPDLLDYDTWYLYGQPEYANYGSVSFSETSVAIPAGQSRSIYFNFTSPATVDTSRNPYFTGYITVTNNNDQFRIPYVGLPYSRSGVENFNTKALPGGPPAFETFKVLANYDQNGSIIGVYDVEDMGLLEFNQTDDNTPFVLLNILFLVQHFRLDIVPVNTKFQSDHWGFDRNQTYDYQQPNATLGSTFLGIETYGNSNNYTMMGPLNRTVAWEDNTIKTDVGASFVAPVGDYRMLISALRWNGNESKRESWETWLSPVVRYII